MLLLDVELKVDDARTGVSHTQLLGISLVTTCAKEQPGTNVVEHSKNQS